jgi:hypothetical protein
MQLVSKVSFFYSADLRTRCARAANFRSHKKKVLLYSLVAPFCLIGSRLEKFSPVVITYSRNILTIKTANTHLNIMTKS